MICYKEYEIILYVILIIIGSITVYCVLFKKDCVTQPASQVYIDQRQQNVPQIQPVAQQQYIQPRTSGGYSFGGRLSSQSNSISAIPFLPPPPQYY